MLLSSYDVTIPVSSMTSTSLGTAAAPAPPIVVPSLGNNIILNPLQVKCVSLPNWTLVLCFSQRGNPILEWHSKCRQRSMETLSQITKLERRLGFYFLGARATLYLPSHCFEVFLAV